MKCLLSLLLVFFLLGPQVQGQGFLTGQASGSDISHTILNPPLRSCVCDSLGAQVSLDCDQDNQLALYDIDGRSVAKWSLAGRSGRVAEVLAVTKLFWP